MTRALRLWVTRARPGAEATAARLAARGHVPLVSPLLTVRGLRPRIDLEGVGALALTSPNGVAAFTRLRPERDRPVYAVGDATAEAARQAGFPTVLSASGDVTALAALITDRHQPDAGAVLIAGAREPAGDLPGTLEKAGMAVRRAAVYATIPAPALRGHRALEAGRLDGVLIHSPRAGQRLASLIGAESARRDAARLAAFCISDAAAAPLTDLGFATLAIAPHPDEASLLDLIPQGPLGKPGGHV